MTRFATISLVALFLTACGSSEDPPAGGDKDPHGDAAVADSASAQKPAYAQASAMACAHVQASCMEETWRCTEYGEGDLATAKADCTSGGGTFSEAPCPRAASVGGCTFAKDTPCRDTWWYGPITADIVHISCSDDGFLSP